jgi:predicted glycoside hydrolase/deacetylase ChbG (UPF0249 family)
MAKTNLMARTRFCIWLLVCLAFALFVANAQQSVTKQSLAEKLGLPANSRMVIIHADDVGMTHSVNAATIEALSTGLVNSASIMVPCPWFPEIADYAKSHREVDFGVHLTLTSERVYYRWGPAASKDRVLSLLDPNGYFQHDWPKETHIDPSEVETELHAQVDRAYAMGIRPTHLDSHQYRLVHTNKDLFAVFVRVAHAYKLPFFVTRDWFTENPYLETMLAPTDIVIDHTVTIEPTVPPEKWSDFYTSALKNLQPGVTEFVIHLAFADDEMKAATRERDTWGAAWRQRDFDFFTSPQFRQLLLDQNIKLVTWRELSRTGL